MAGVEGFGRRHPRAPEEIHRLTVDVTHKLFFHLSTFHELAVMDRKMQGVHIV